MTIIKHPAIEKVAEISMGIKVQKRDGSLVDLDITKIRKVVGWACEGLTVQSVALESRMSERLVDGVTTRDIQRNLINCALQMCSPEQPDWRYVAGRLHMWNIWKEVELSRGYDQSDYYIHVNHMTEKGYYAPDLLSSYLARDLTIAGSWRNIEYDSDYDYAGATLLSRRYLLQDELPQEMYLTIALLLAKDEKGNRLDIAQSYYRALAMRKISLATPFIANLRKPNGSLTSCFVLAMEDNLESIFREITNTARISKNGGGVGMCVSNIRATGSKLMGINNAAKGVVPWIKIINDTMLAVDQAGQRTGAATVALDIWHLDIPEFLEMQLEHGDQRRKAHDVFPQVVVNDEFMKRAELDQDWYLVCPFEVKELLGIDLPKLWGIQFELAYLQVENRIKEGDIKLFKKVKAKDLLKKIMRSQIETGMPYMFFKDTVNCANPNKHVGYIPAGNLCQESYSSVTAGVTAHCCNLISLNLATIPRNDVGYYSEMAVRMLDTSIDLTKPPFEDAKAHNDLYRTIGVGAMGLADYLAVNELKYNSREARENVDNLFEDIAYHCTYQSMLLAKDKGAFKAFKDSEWNKDKLMNSLSVETIIDRAYEKERWASLAADIKRYGIRNSQLTAIAPNTSSSLLQGCTASILPIFSRFFYDKAKNAPPVAPPFINEAYWYYQENKTMNQSGVIQMTATIQKWIDTGISMELMFNTNEGIYWSDEPKRRLTARDMFDHILEAWKSGCKAIYYVRTVQKDDFKECTVCAN